jgi:hypothetical protein
MLDAMVSLGGEVFTDQPPGAPWITQQAVISAWRKLQDTLFANGYERLVDKSILWTVPPVATTDPGIFTRMNWSEYFDGVNTWPAGSAAPVLPPLLIEPLEVRERPTGSGIPFQDMTKVLKGLPTVPKLGWNALWEWRGDSLYMPGATGTSTDLEMRFLSYLPDPPSGPTPGTVNGAWLVPIARCLDPLANYICYEWAMPRGDVDAGAFQAAAEAGVMKMLGRPTIDARAVYKVSELGKQGDAFTPAMRQMVGGPPQQ